MLFLVGTAVISAALLLVVVARRAVDRPDAPRWLHAAAHGNGVALLATIMLASGVGLLLDSAMSRGDMLGLALAVLGFALPFAGLWFMVRGVPAVASAEAAALPPAGGGHPRRGRTAARPAGAADAAVASRKAG